LNCSDETAAEIDAEVVAIIKESYDKALEMLRENRDVMDKLAEYLIEKETITGKEFMEIFRREKGLPEPEEKSESVQTQTPESGESEPQKNGEDVTKEKHEAEPEIKEQSWITQPQVTPDNDGSRGIFSNGKLD
jgi:cell division protease FtsH